MNPGDQTHAELRHSLMLARRQLLAVVREQEDAPARVETVADIAKLTRTPKVTRTPYGYRWAVAAGVLGVLVILVSVGGIVSLAGKLAQPGTEAAVGVVRQAAPVAVQVETSSAMERIKPAGFDGTPEAVAVVEKRVEAEPVPREDESVAAPAVSRPRAKRPARSKHHTPKGKKKASKPRRPAVKSRENR